MKKNWKILKKRNIVRSEIDAPMGTNTACDNSIVCEAIKEQNNSIITLSRQFRIMWVFILYLNSEGTKESVRIRWVFEL